MSPWILWGGFTLFVVLMLWLDLAVFNRKAHEVHLGEALGWSAFWIALALLFDLGVYHFAGPERAMKFLAGYVLEKSLSVDNLFVFVLVFSYFKVPPMYQHRVLFWGILGALIMRAIFILAGVALIERFHWIIYVFGAFLVYTGIKIGTGKDKEMHPEKNPVMLFFRRILPVTDGYREGKLVVREGGRWYVTPLFLVLIIIESTDVVFAVDSIPAILAITTDSFIVYTSNVFAILGLRALYFALAGLMKLFHYLNYGLAVILVFVGCKMLASHYYHVPIVVALGVILGVLAVSVIASLLWPRKDGHAH